MKTGEIAKKLEGELTGDPMLDIKGVSGLAGAREGDITFLRSRKYLKDLKNTRASCLIVKETVPEFAGPQIKVPDPYYAFARLLGVFYAKPRSPFGVMDGAFVSKAAALARDVSVYPLSYISDGVSIGRGTVIHPFVFVGEGVSIGEDCLLYPNVVVREGVRVGNRVIIHPGAVIGSDGFGYTFHEGEHYKVPQVGGVLIEDDVEIGANVTVDRATTGDTVIGKGTKIDNLVQVGHNVKIGRGVILVSQAAVGGSAEIGDFTAVGGQTGIADHASIEAGTMLGARSGVMPGELPKGTYSGAPAMPHTVWLKASAIMQRLPELVKRLRALEETVEKLQRRPDGH